MGSSADNNGSKKPNRKEFILRYLIGWEEPHEFGPISAEWDGSHASNPRIGVKWLMWFKQGLDCSVVPALTPTVSDICGSFLTASDLLPSLLEVWSLEWLFIMLCPHALFKTPVAFSPGTPMWSHATYFSKIILWGSKVTGHDDSWYFTCCLLLASSEKCMGAIVIIVPDRSVSMSNRKFPRRRRSECAS
ncbi:hypothetical protein C8R41DRAFT_863026 [Lentinula lateritia]|uniref:Uncharacterized protein n=1 Tax=Lentinula lateritia TaxID=40482 RepID=A0ABQ8W1J6_9AGAR|nr:hypothetical protein C8R41DRAFT_863026 [Lentinula lateritia]